jgi:hypothetical protein
MKRFAHWLAASLLASTALAAPPPAPTVTVAATDIKQLQFDVTPVPTVGWYELWFRALPGAEWVKYTQTPPQRPNFRIGVPVHLLDWRQARYHVKACNPSGCAASNEVGVNGEQLTAMGYLKSALSGPHQYLGFSLAVSADGTTAASIVNEYRSNVTYATVQVFRRTTATSAWRLDARLSPVPNFRGGASISWGDSIALSGDGNTLVAANWSENQATGAVYLFRRTAEGWQQTQRITGSMPADLFGVHLKIDKAGRTLLISHEQVANETRRGTVEVYQDPDDGSDQFVHVARIPTPEFENAEWGWCRALALSDTGRILRSCFGGAGNLYTQVLTPVSSAPLQYLETSRLPGASDRDLAIDSTGTRALVPDAGGWRVHRLEGSSWMPESLLAPFQNGYSTSADMSADGKIIAIGYTDDNLVGRGPLYELARGNIATGTVAIYDRRASGWKLRRYVKEDTNGQVRHGFGMSVALNQNGNLLAVGAPYDNSTAVRVDGDRDDESSQYRGAVWLY